MLFRSKEAWANASQEANNIVLSNKDMTPDILPSVIGMGAKDAVYLLESRGIKVRISGVGKVKSQSIPAGSRITKNQVINLTLR